MALVALLVLIGAFFISRGEIPGGTPIIGQGTMKMYNGSKIKLSGTTSCCKSCAIDGNPNTLFRSGCTACSDNSTHWVTIILHRKYRDIRVKITKGNKVTSYPAVGVFDYNKEHSMVECIFSGVQYYCSNGHALDAVMIYKEGCIEFGEAKVYVGIGDRATLDHCERDGDPKNLLYRGYMNASATDKPCIKWKLVNPIYRPLEPLFNARQEAETNYCRNPLKADSLFCFNNKYSRENCKKPPKCGPRFQMSVL